MIYQILMIIAVFVMASGTLLVTLMRKKQPRLSTKYWDLNSTGAIFIGGFPACLLLLESLIVLS